MSKLLLGGKIPVDFNLHEIMQPVSHGRESKNLVVLHETVSPDSAGLSDIIANAKFLAANGLGIHAIVDGEANFGWAWGLRKQLMYHAKGHNHGAIGIEQVSAAPLLPFNEARVLYWKQRRKQLDKVAQVLAFISRVDKVPLRYSDSTFPGITSHWDVSQANGIAGGHWDCKPKHKGGHYPILYVVYRARQFYDKFYPEDF